MFLSPGFSLLQLASHATPGLDRSCYRYVAICKSIAIKSLQRCILMKCVWQIVQHGWVNASSPKRILSPSIVSTIKIFWFQTYLFRDKVLLMHDEYVSWSSSFFFVGTQRQRGNIDKQYGSDAASRFRDNIPQKNIENNQREFQVGSGLNMLSAIQGKSLAYYEGFCYLTWVFITVGPPN